MPSRWLAATVLCTTILVSGCARKTAAPPPPSTAPRSAARIPSPGAQAGPPSLYPNLDRTPGFPNPAITQDNVAQNICNPHWSTKSIRPPASYTNKLKRDQMQQWGLPGKPADYEEDHFISLELGGHPRDPRNLWPEAYLPKPGAREKDQVEDYLHRQVCSGAMTLQDAQKAITADWYRVYLQTHPQP